jgi:hypothetical protein
MADQRYTLSKQDRRLMQEAIRVTRAGKTSQRPVPTRRRNRSGGSGPKTVVITASISAASWDSAEGKLTPTTDTESVFVLAAHEDDDGTYAYDSASPITVTNWFNSAITVTSGNGKIAQVIGGRIFNVDCNEIDLGV